MGAQVLYLSFDGLTDPLGQSQILPYMRELSLKGNNITIISFEKSNPFKANSNLVFDTCAVYGIDWIPLIYHKGIPILSTIYDLYILRLKCNALFKTKKIGIVHCRSYITSLVGIYLKRKYDTKYIFDMRGFWPDERVEGKVWNLNKPVYRLVYNYFKWAEMKFITQADHIISLTENAKTEILSWQNDLSEVSVIPTCVDMDLFNPDNVDIGTAKEFENSLGLRSDDFLFIYIGSWGTWYLTDDILSFFKIAKSTIPKAKLLILTPDNPDLGDMKFDPAISIKKAKRHEVPIYLSLAQASICLVKPSFSKKASSATKMAESWAMNKRVITNPGWGDINWLTENQSPMVEVIKESTLSEFRNMALRLSQLSNQVEFRKDLIGKFDLKSGVSRYDEIYRKLNQK